MLKWDKWFSETCCRKLGVGGVPSYYDGPGKPRLGLICYGQNWWMGMGFRELSGESLNFLIGPTKRIEIFEAGPCTLLDAGSVSQIPCARAEKLILIKDALFSLFSYTATMSTCILKPCWRYSDHLNWNMCWTFSVVSFLEKETCFGSCFSFLHQVKLMKATLLYPLDRTNLSSLLG
jgi:hypothetical protein